MMLPAGVMADGLDGFVDLTYTASSTKTTDASGQTVKTDSSDFFQRYNFLFEKTIFPKIRFDAGGILEKDHAITTTNGVGANSTDTRFRPYATLTLRDPLYSAGIGYSLREEIVEASRSQRLTTELENYDAFLGWKPVDLPTLDGRYTRTKTWDRDRTVINSLKDYFSLTSRYRFRGFDLSYFGTYTDTTDKLVGLETRDVTHNGRGTYTNTFLNGRAVFSTSYNIVHDVVTTASSGGREGVVSIQLFPFAGLSAISDSLLVGALNQNPPLIDGNLTAGAGINLGLPGLGGDTARRNIGLDFLTGSEVNSLFVWVDRELPLDIANSFSWDIYTSADNLNWVFSTTVLAAPFGPFQNRFEITFPNVTARYVKVVVRPLQPAVPGASGFPNILVTEMQAFLTRPVGAESLREKFVNTSQTSNTDFRYRILDRPLLFYEGSYFFTKRDTSSQGLETLSNAFSLSHQFYRIFTGTAKIGREDGSERDQKRVSYVYNASIMAVPLNTLSTSLMYSGRNETLAGETTSSNSLFFNSTAQLYKGIDLNLNGGVNRSTDLGGAKIESLQANLGANLVPHPTLTWTFFLSYGSTDRSGGGLTPISSVNRRANVTAAFSPFRTLYLLASLDVLDESGQEVKTLRNYGLSWSPFQDGALQFRFAYNESRRPEDQTTDRTFSPGLRYNMSKRSYLDISYQAIHSKSPEQTTDSKALTANVRLTL